MSVPAACWVWLCTVLLWGVACRPGSGRAQAVANTLLLQPAPDTVADPYRRTVMQRYKRAGLAASGLDSAVFYKAYTGFLNLRAQGRTSSPMLAMVDFGLPGTVHRMWIVDTGRDSLLLHTWAAHGKGSGREMARVFSNTPGSLQTSLGFYLTAEIYTGKNGRSLKLDGLDAGFNTNARKRYVVMHGADYVSQDTIAAYGLLGNSEGCPAVSHAVNYQVIDWMKGKGVLFITGPDSSYHSKWLDEPAAWRHLQLVQETSGRVPAGD